MSAKREITANVDANLEHGTSAQSLWLRRRWVIYSFVVALTAATFFLRFTLSAWIGSDRPVLILFEIPIVISAYLGGMGPGLLSTVLTGLGVPYFVLPQILTLNIGRPVDLMQWAIMVTCGALISIMSGMLYRSRQQAEANERLQTTTISSIGDALITVDADGRITFLNEEAQRLTGWAGEAAIGSSLTDVFIVSDQETGRRVEDWPKEVLRLERSKKTVNSHVLVARDRREIPIDDCCSPIKSRDGTVKGAVLIFSDRSEQRQAEMALRESEEKYRALFESMIQGTVYKGADGSIIDANPAAVEILGLSFEQLLGKRSQDDSWDMIHEDGTPFLAAEHPSVVALKTGAPVKDVVAGVFNTRKKAYVWMLINAIPQFHPGEAQPYQTFITLHDITERRRAEQQVRRREEHFRNLVALAPDAIFIHTEGHFAYLNKAAVDLFGASSANQLVGLPVIDRLHSDCRELIRERMALLTVEKKAVPKLEHQYIRLDGSTVDVQAAGVPFRYEGKDGALVFVRNISDRKKAEDALRAGEAKYKELSRQFNAVLEAIPDQLSLIAPDFKTLWANKIAIDNMPIKEDYSAGESCYNLWHHRSEPCETCLISDVIKEAKPLTRVSSEADGTSWEYRLIPVKDDGDDGAVITGVLRLGRDISENRKLEAQLRHAQKLEAIGTLAGGIAHDFNNILAPIIGYTEMAMDGMDDPSASRFDLERVLAAANRAKDLVKQILSFSRLGEEQLMRPVDVGLILKEALKLLRASLPSTIQIRQDIHQVMAVADATQMHQIIVNLCTNAAHAMEDTGILDVSLQEVALSAQDLTDLRTADLKPGRYLKLSVKDTGKGMNPETMQRVFDPYFTTKEVGKGTGLGLAVVHGIVLRHGGEIAVRSQPGQGSVFEVYLPAVEVKPAIPIPSPPALPTGSERILVVDDEPAIAFMVAKMLGQLGYRTSTKTDPQEARHAFLSNPREFDMVITDFTMPGLTGIQLAHEMLRVEPEIPIILCTGFSEKISEVSARELGIAGFAMKPLDRKQLTELVRNVLDDNRQQHLS